MGKVMLKERYVFTCWAVANEATRSDKVGLTVNEGRSDLKRV